MNTAGMGRSRGLTGMGRRRGLIRVCALALILIMTGLLLVPAQISHADTVTYTVTVTGGRAALSPGGESLTTVEITDGDPFIFFVFADPSDADREFDHWEAEGVVLTDYQKFSSCFTMSMPASDLVLTAVFRDTDPDKRLAGPNRYATSQAVANDYMKGRAAGYFSSVVVASGDTFPDALAGSYLAATLDAPLLMVNSATVSNVAGYIRSHAYPSSTVYILGGTAAVPASFETLITSSEYGFKTVRLSGSNRYTTNISILDSCGACSDGRSEDLIVCSGKDFADALSASSLGFPILLVGDTLLPEQLAFLQRGGIGNIYIAGGIGAVSPSIEEKIIEITGKTPVRLSGANRYETSAAIAEYFSGGTSSDDDPTGGGDGSGGATGDIDPPGGGATGDIDPPSGGATGGGSGGATGDIDPPGGGATGDWTEESGPNLFSGDLVFFASGSNFPDGLAGGPLAYTYGAPLLLIDNYRTTAAAKYNEAHSLTKSVTLGGTGVLSDAVVMQAKTPLAEAGSDGRG